jgi:tetratricopeptide (TPR) repeat protein
MSSESPTPTWLDPHDLIERSRGRTSVFSGWPLWVAVGLIVLFLSSPQEGPVAGVLHYLAPLMLIGLWIATTTLRVRLSNRIERETQAVVTLEELIQLRRWPEATELAQRLLGRPMLVPDRRLSALMNLATLLSRYHRFADARVVHEYLLTPEPYQPQPDGPTAHAIRVARAMSMLRDDHLVDADRAMSELRREVRAARDQVRREQGTEAADSIQSAGLTLLDLYRDMKTGHSVEAIHTFELSIASLRDQLGVRVADAWVLCAAARHALGQADAAQEAYANATTLVPAVELHRRYPETAILADIYQAARWPGGTP